ncbi:dihydrolipoamide acetyltransferase family protein [Brevibacillus sp. B_LB10_24]|uniref:dihydrolipoamide acetyltransferase family protein n=1 Tax=Brevibacillus sp. B_LB10_24 TaxID=3380645 RepID=UPI0038BBC12B
MATKVLMPQLGESVTEGTISRWLVKSGDVVNKYDPLAEVTTDKVNAEVPAALSGRIVDILVPEGETVAVGTPIMSIEEAGGAATAEPSVEPAPAVAGEGESPVLKPIEFEPARVAPVTGKQRYSPAVMRLAQEHDIDLSQVTGTGAEGRITRKDVQKIIEQGGLSKAPAPASAATPQAAEPAAAPSVSPVAGDQVIPVSSVRKTIASRMVQSKHEIPHAWMMVEADVTNLVNYRNKVKDEFKQKEGINLTYLPFFIKAVVEALKEYPMLNSSWDKDQIIVRKDINISIAVATEDALYVPVIKAADQKSIYGIAKAIEDLAARTRAGKLTVDDMAGGTFTVNNTGSFGSVLSVPIINAPQAAILSVESIVKRPVVINDMIAIRSMVNLCLSLDHRVLDGLVCGRFLQRIKEKLENIGPQTNMF